MTRDELGLLRWQWSLYAEGHRSKRNLLIHLLTWPFYLVGTMLFFLSLQWKLMLAGAVMMLVAMASQKMGHAGEQSAPAPFRGPLDVVQRFFVEQWITFPRYLFSGEYSRAWSRAQ